LKGILALIVQRGGRDWSGRGTPLVRTTGPLVIHRVFPAQYLIDRGQSPDLILNFTVLPQSTSGRLAGLPPHQALEGRARLDFVETHFIDPDVLLRDDLSEF